MIFLTIGTHEPFDRLVRAVDTWAGSQPGANVFAQITDPGPHGYRPKHFKWTVRMPPTDFEATVAGSKFLVAHAGMGSIITAMSHARPIAILPRRGHLGETRNDHQFATARKLQSKPGVFVAMDEIVLPQILDRLLLQADPVETSPIASYAEDSLIAALRDFINGPPTR